MRQISASLPEKLTGAEKEISLIQDYNLLYASLSFYSIIEIIGYFENLSLASDDDCAERVDSIYRKLEKEISYISSYCSPSARSKFKDILTVFKEKRKRTFDLITESENVFSKLSSLIENEDDDKIFSPDNLINYHQDMMDSFPAAWNGNSIGELRPGYSDYLGNLKKDIQTILMDTCSSSVFNQIWSKLSL